MRKLSAFLLSLFTIVGGHILNRRADKALLFFSLLLVVALINLYSLPLLTLFEGVQTMPGISSYWQLLPISIATSLGLVALSSALVSYLDAGKPLEGSRVTIPALLGGILAVLIASPVAGYMAYYASINLQLSEQMNDVINTDEDGEASKEKSDSARGRAFHGSGTHFWHNVRYSFRWTPEENLSPLPKGDAYISGHIDYNGAPAVGVTLTGIFNDRYLSEEVTTDDEGRFTFELAGGEWRLNRIHTTAWSDKPDSNDFSLIGSAHPKLTEKLYNESPDYESHGLVLSTHSEPQPEPALQITIRDNLSLDWPDREAVSATLTDDVIRWQPVENAVSYQVQLQEITREGSTTSYYPVYWNNTGNSKLPLKQIQTTSDAVGSRNEYNVLVHAFDASGQLITSSPEHFPLLSLVIEDRQIPSMQQFPSLMSGSASITEEDVEQMQKERKLIDAATVLAEEEMPAAARKLMGKINSNHMEKRQDTLEGLILTAEGNCEEARLHFEAINQKWKRDCLPDFYKQRCQSQK
jgi:hypothetical protein